MSTVVIIITIMKKLIFFNFRMGMKKREAGERRGVFSVKTKKKKKFQRARVLWLPEHCPGSPTSKTLALFFFCFLNSLTCEGCRASVASPTFKSIGLAWACISGLSGYFLVNIC